MRQRLLLEEYGATIKHVAGEKNVVADTLSRIDYCDVNAKRYEWYTNDATEGVSDFDNFHVAILLQDFRHQKIKKNMTSELNYVEQTSECTIIEL